MNIKDLLGIELLYREGIDNKVLMKIPNTKFHLIFTYVKSKDSWNVHALELMSTKRAVIATGITKQAASSLAEMFLRNAEISFKDPNNLKQFALELSKLLITKNKHHELQ